MINSVEVWNYESHQHSKFDFGPNMNLLCGTSDSGKSSLLRAICLPAYNRWNEDMLRVGTKSAKVVVTTERGSVEIERGPGIHRWLVKWLEEGKEKSEAYSKLGRGNVPERASWVMGMPKVEIAGTESLPNTMFQMDKPFLLSEFEGKSCSSSVVAQVIDELSGLVGLEELMREINLDLARSKRSIGDVEGRISALEEKKLLLPDAAAVRSVAERAGEGVKEVALLLSKKDHAASFLAGLIDLSTKYEAVVIPKTVDFDQCTRVLAEAASDVSRLKKAQLLRTSVIELVGVLGEVQKKMDGMPDYDGLRLVLEEAQADNVRKMVLQRAFDSIHGVDGERIRVESTLSRIPDCNKLSEEIQDCVLFSSRLKEVSQAVTQIRGIREEQATTSAKLLLVHQKLSSSQNELKELMKDSCPVCGQSLEGSSVMKSLFGGDQ